MTKPDLFTVLVALVGSGGLGWIVHAAATNRKIRAEAATLEAAAVAASEKRDVERLDILAHAAQITVVASTETIKTLQDQLDRLERKIDDQEAELVAERTRARNLESRIVALEYWIRAQGANPDDIGHLR